MDIEQKARELAEALETHAWDDCGERNLDTHIGNVAARFIQDLAAALTSTQQQLEEARGALKPFADCVEQISENESDEEWAKFRLLIGDYRRANRALASLGDGR